VLEEPSLPPAGRIPSLAGNREAEAYSRSALAAMPQRALVLATWATYTPLRHVRLLEHQRPDLTLELATIETAAIRVRQWRSDPATRRRAIVFTESNAMLDPFRAGLDSIPLASGRALYVLAPNRRVAARAAAPDTAGRP
jgi:hypothetical protein